VIHLDTGFLIRAGRRGTPEDQRLRTWVGRREIVRVSAVTWAEFLCGPVSTRAMEDAAELFGEPAALSGVDATLAAHLFNATGRRRGSLADCTISAIAMNAGAALATSNLADFEGFVSLGLTIETP